MIITFIKKKPNAKKPQTGKQTQKSPMKLKQTEHLMLFQTIFSTEKQVNC